MNKPNDLIARKPPKKAAGPPARVRIHAMPTGVPGLDEILGGGVPEFSFNIVAGTPGCGKTTMVHQIAFANGTPKKPALLFTVLGEPVLCASSTCPTWRWRRI
jgi:circadian clock protein KaiC